jgi:hypothetical protein
MPHIHIEGAVAEKMPGLEVNQETFVELATLAELDKPTVDELSVVITETIPERRKRLGAGAGRYMSFGHPTGGYYGRDKEIRVYRRGAPTPEDMTTSIIRGIAAAWSQRGTDYEQTDLASRLQYTYLAGGAAVGAAIGNVPALLHATVGSAENMGDWIFNGSWAGGVGGVFVGLFRGMSVAMDRYPNAGSGGLGFYMAEGVSEHLNKLYTERFAQTAPLVTVAS